MRTVDELDIGYAQIDLPKLEPRVGVLQNLVGFDAHHEMRTTFKIKTEVNVRCQGGFDS